MLLQDLSNEELDTYRDRLTIIEYQNKMNKRDVEKLKELYGDG